MFSLKESWRLLGKSKVIVNFRFEISRSAEKAYSILSLDDAKVIFSIQDTNTLKKFIESEQKHANEKGMEWKVEGNNIKFIPVILIIQYLISA